MRTELDARGACEVGHVRGDIRGSKSFYYMANYQLLGGMGYLRDSLSAPIMGGHGDTR